MVNTYLGAENKLEAVTFGKLCGTSLVVNTMQENSAQRLLVDARESVNLCPD